MEPLFADHYKNSLPFLKQAVDSVLPVHSSDLWLSKIVGKPRFEWNHEVITDVILKPMHSYIHRTGKLFRPYLVNLCLEAYNVDKEFHKEIIGLSEIIHSASLMADDITDNSEMRRGQMTAHCEFGLPIAGLSCASMFNLGNYLLTREESNLPPGVVSRLLRELVWEHFVTGLGTGIDLSWSEFQVMNIPLEAYFDHLLYRSCSYTYRMPLKIGALIAQAPEQDYNILVEFGEMTGQAFQLIDDILNLTPLHADWGKKVGEDITAGKRTLLVLHTLKLADNRERAKLVEILDSKTDSEEDIDSAIQLMNKYDAFNYAFLKAGEFIDRLLPRLDDLSMPMQYKSILKSFAQYVIHRQI
jgi:geranylgeranyl pyrophosphate synthase